MIKDPGTLSFWIIDSEGKRIEASDNLEKLLERAQEVANKVETEIDVVHYLGSFYPENEQFPETL